MRNKKSYIDKAIEHGIDITLIESNLNKTPTQRILALQESADFMLALQKSGREYYAKLPRKDQKG